MQNIKVSLSNNILKISTIENREFKGVSADVSADVVKDYEILNTSEFTRILRDLIGTVTKKSHNALSLDVIIEPQEVYLKFVTVNKRDGEVGDQIVNEVRTKMRDVPLDEIYFSFIKIAPFVYQFVGVRKEKIDILFQISNDLGIQLRSIIAWVLLLPKFVETNEPAIFLSNTSGKQIVALSEFNGVFFSGVYEKEKTTEELQKLVKELSVYKRTKPISKVYVYNCDSFSLNPGYEVTDIKIPNSDLPEAQGYDIHLLIEYMVENDPNLIFSQKNLVNIAGAVVVAQKKSTALVYIGSSALILLLVGGLVGGVVFSRNKNIKPTQSNDTKQVLSDQTKSEPTPTVTPTPTPTPTEVLNKADLVVRVENGAGIPGIAGKTQTFLSSLGYKVPSVGNAAESGRSTTLVKIKATKAKYQDLLKTDLSKSFTVVMDTTLDASLDYDVLVVVGTDAKI